jgi:hypothetical protein
MRDKRLLKFDFIALSPITKKPLSRPDTCRERNEFGNDCARAGCTASPAETRVFVSLKLRYYKQATDT